MRIHFIVHEAFEAPGVYYDWAIKRGHDVIMTKLYQGKKLPKDSSGIDLLIVMGGPQSPRTTVAECPHFDAQAEISLIKEAISQDKRVLGICLGAQLLGEAYGASVERSPEKEIGNYPITLTEAGLANRNLSHIGTSAIVGHWHGDMPGLTPQAKILATSQGCPRQIVKYSDKHYAFQCHLEFSKPLIEALLAEEVDYDEQVKTYSYLQVANEMLAYDYSEMNHILEQFLDAFTK